MPRWVFLVAALISSACSLAFAYIASQPATEPGLWAAENVHDFGELSQGDKVSFEFQLVNRFDQSVTIRNVIKSCSCTRADRSRDVVPPGEQVTLNVEWDLGASRGQSAIHLTVLAVLPTGEGIAKELRLSAKVVPDINYSPEGLEFAPSMKKQQIRFTPGRMSEFILKGAYCTHKAFEAQLLPDGVSVEVTFHPEAVSEELPEAFLVVKTTSLHQPKTSIPLSVVTGR